MKSDLFKILYDRMKFVIVTFLLLSSHLLLAQTCDTIIDGEPMNCVDRNSIKQGTWVSFEKKSRYCFDTEGTMCISKIGDYKDGVKIGTWRYFNGPKYNSGMTKELVYKLDGSIEENTFGFFGIQEKNIYKHTILISKEVNSNNFNYKYSFNKKNMEIKGQLFFSDTENIDLRCKNDTCIFTLSNGLELLRFKSPDLNKFEFELARLDMGLYQREINILKNSIR